MDVRIRFGGSYTNNSNSCTGVRMIQENFCKEVSIDSCAGIILYPYCDMELNEEDILYAERNGIDFIDAPWEELTEIVDNLKKDKTFIVRKIPSSFIAKNEYYRQKNPVYFTESTRFSTVEAVIISLSILQQKNQAKEIAEKFNLLYVLEACER